jgi:hypothetical protein
MPSKIDSNRTGLRYAEEVIGTPGVLPGSPVWRPLEPNSYGEFGAQITTVARAPINAARQRKKGMVTDLDATAGFQSDFVQESLYDLMQGFFFADWRKKPNVVPTAVTAPSYTVASSTGFATNDLVEGSGFAVAGNNGLKLVTSVTGTTIVAPGPAAAASWSAAGPSSSVASSALSSDGGSP